MARHYALIKHFMTAKIQSLLRSYKAEKFLDSADFKKYLTSEETHNENTEFELVNKIVDDISYIRFKAEERYRQNQYKVYSKKKALPIPWEEIEDELTKKIKKEPPRRIITTIAQKHFTVLKRLTESLKKNLRRERQKVHLSAVQQLDSYCMKWLTRQLGQNQFEKAGSSQKIYAVVRNEDIDTLENRVLKDFLKRIIPLAARYLKKYKTDFPNNDIVKAVQSLENFCKEQLLSSQFKSISNLKQYTIPNYTLQYHPLYSIIWEQYRLLIHQTQLAELVWKWRVNLFAEYFILSAFAFSNGVLTDEKPLFKNEAWISFSPEYGRFFNQTAFYNVFFKNEDSLFEMKMSSDVLSLDVLDVSRFSKTAPFQTTKYVPIYIPSFFAEEIVFPDDRYTYIVFNGSSSNLKGKFIPYDDNFNYEEII